MEFGISINRDETPDVSGEQALAAALERAHAARDAGFDLLGFSNRYSVGPASNSSNRLPLSSWQFQPLPLIAYIAGELKGTIAYSTNVLVSPSLHPVSLAEQVATLDAICHGRLHVGIGLGWMDYEFEAFGVLKRDRVRRFIELVQVYRRLLTDERVDFDGQFFQLNDVSMLARSVQRPMPPLWLGGSVDSSVKRAARLGDAWIASGHIQLRVLERQLQLFIAERERASMPPPTQFPIVRTVYVDETREKAIATAEPAMRARYKERGDRGWFLTHGKDTELADSAWSSGRWIIGSPDDCVEQIMMFGERLGITHMILSYKASGPGSKQEQLLRLIQLLGDRVIPYCKST